MRISDRMIKLNGAEYEFRPGLSLSGLADEYNHNHAKVDFANCVVVINDAVIPAEKARELVLNDSDNIIIVPKLDGG